MPTLKNKLKEAFCVEFIKDFDAIRALQRLKVEYQAAIDTAAVYLSDPEISARVKELNQEVKRFSDQLSTRDKLFCERFIETFEPVDAAAYAGYDVAEAEQVADKILQDDLAVQYLAHLRSNSVALMRVSRPSVLNELAAIAMANPTDVAEWDADGVRVKPSASLTREQAACISEIKQTKDGVAVKFHNKLKALEMLATAMSLFNTETAMDRKTYDRIRTETKAMQSLTPEQLAVLAGEADLGMGLPSYRN